MSSSSKFNCWCRLYNCNSYDWNILKSIISIDNLKRQKLVPDKLFNKIRVSFVMAKYMNKTNKCNTGNAVLYGLLIICYRKSNKSSCECLIHCNLMSESVPDHLTHQQFVECEQLFVVIYTNQNNSASGSKLMLPSTMVDTLQIYYYF